jgi:hypothetical protein
MSDGRAGSDPEICRSGAAGRATMVRVSSSTIIIT